MQKIDATVIKETKYVALWVLILSVLMQAVFLVIGRWNYTVLLGNLLAGSFSVLNFFLMGLSVQKALGKEEKDARNTLKLSRTYRSLALFAVAALGVVLPVFDRWAVIIALFFPAIAVYLRPLFDEK